MDLMIDVSAVQASEMERLTKQAECLAWALEKILTDAVLSLGEAERSEHESLLRIKARAHETLETYRGVEIFEGNLPW